MNLERFLAKLSAEVAKLRTYFTQNRRETRMIT